MSESKNQKRKDEQRGQGLLRAETCLPSVGADVLSPDSPLQKPGEGPSPRLALSLPLGAVMRPEPTGRRPGPAVHWKGSFLEVPPPPLPHPSQLCSWKLKELGSVLTVAPAGCRTLALTTDRRGWCCWQIGFQFLHSGSPAMWSGASSLSSHKPQFPHIYIKQRH